MVGNMWDSGQIIICMDKECIFGLMAENMKGNIRMIKNMDLAAIIGLMDACMKAGGRKANKADWENIMIKKVLLYFEIFFRDKIWTLGKWAKNSMVF